MKSWLANKKDRLLAGTIIAGASLALAGPAIAQEAQAPLDRQNSEEEIIVTGSRIPQPNLVGVSPVQQIVADEIASRGVTRIEDMINQLPQAFAAENSGVSNGTAATAQADLRSLGSMRTLVLIDNRRLVPGDPGANTNSAAPDLNAIPAALVERVEALTGGASAVYGADAVAGVINFIMMDDFEGVRLDAQYGFYHHSNENDELGNLRERAGTTPRFFAVPGDNVVDGESTDFTIVLGANTEDDRGNVTAYASYRNIKPIVQADRGFSACTFNSGASFTCGGSSTTYPSFLRANTQVENFQNGAFVEVGPQWQVGSGGPGEADLISFAAAGQFNFGETNYYQRPDERYTLGAFARYEVNPHLEFYTQLMFMDDRSVAQIAPSGLFRAFGLGSLNGGYTVNCDNQYFSAAEIAALCDADSNPDIVDNPATPANERQNAIDALVRAGRTVAGATALVDGSVADDSPVCPDPDPVTPGNQALCVVTIGHRNVNGAPRQDDQRHTMYRAVAGVRGDLVQGWEYDAYAQYGTTIYQDHFLNEVSLSRVNKALINIGGECGVNVDDNPTNDDIACVPLDVFSSVGPTAEQLAYVGATGFMMGSTTQQVFNASLTGDLGAHGFQSRWAADGVGVAVGTEYRREESELRPDSSFCPGTAVGTVSDLLGQGSTTCPVSGAYDVVEFFGEARIPIAQDAPFFEQLGLELAYRYSDYSTGIQTDTYRIGGDWGPVEDIRFRGGFNRAVRAPNIVELFQPQAVGLSGTLDPCAGVPGGDPSDDPIATEEECALTGVAPGQYGNIVLNPAGQYNALLGGNPDLQPEVADTITAGFVFTPTFLSGLTVAIDWYNIQIEDRIGGIGADTVILGCIETGDPFLCGLIHRAPGTGSLWLGPSGFIDNLTRNAGSIETTGVDVEGNYRIDFADWGLAGAGAFSINFVGAYLNEYLITAPAAGTQDCAGLYGPLCSGAMGGFGNPLPEWRHKLRIAWSTPWPGLQLAGTWRHVNEVELETGSAQHATDLTLPATGYFDLAGTWDIRDNVTFRAGVNNLLDTDPPLTGQANCPSGVCNGNTWPGLYDVAGRYVFFGVTADF